MRCIGLSVRRTKICKKRSRRVETRRDLFWGLIQYGPSARVYTPKGRLEKGRLSQSADAQCVNEGQQHQNADHDQNHRQTLCCDFRNRHIGDGGSKKQIAAVGRGDEADGQVHGHHNAEVDGVHPNARDNGKQNGRQNDAGGDVVDEAVRNQGIGSGHHSGFGGGENTAVNSARNDYRHQQRPD
ncbi:hypothetical protein SDC9_62022 [bioreactor metagenome]|uniref:Uncharacterized protein n=1 Tax=bioreactor metagenome TaxID=1076179 RepID=A0A644XIP7_9ZZZZ